MLQGKSEDEIYLSEKQRCEQTAGAKPTKITGYVGPEEYDRRQSLLMRSRSMSSAFGVGFGIEATQSLSTSSLSLIGGDVSSSLFGSQSQSQLQPSNSSQSSLTASQIITATDDRPSLSESVSTERLVSVLSDLGPLCTEHRVQLSANKTRPPLHNGNSTSKSNTKTGVLRENDQRPKSGQKLLSGNHGEPALQFSGRDQKNVSPYGTSARLGSLGKSHAPLLLGGGAASMSGVGANIMKAKRQISFDS